MNSFKIRLIFLAVAMGNLAVGMHKPFARIDHFCEAIRYAFNGRL